MRCEDVEDEKERYMDKRGEGTFYTQNGNSAVWSLLRAQPLLAPGQPRGIGGKVSYHVISCIKRAIPTFFMASRLSRNYHQR